MRRDAEGYSRGPGIDGDQVRDQTDASLGLLDAISDDGEAVMSVQGKDGAQRSVTLSVPDPAVRHKLTEPYQRDAYGCRASTSGQQPPL